MDDDTNFSVGPGGRVLWCLRRRASDVRGVLYAEARPVAVHVLQDRDVVLSEIFMSEAAALEWARQYREQLKQHGWDDVPQDCSPSSAA